MERESVFEKEKYRRKLGERWVLVEKNWRQGIWIEILDVRKYNTQKGEQKKI